MNLKSYPLQGPHTSQAPTLSPGPAQLLPLHSLGLSLTRSVPWLRAPVSTLVRKHPSSAQKTHSSDFYTKSPSPPQSSAHSNLLAPCAHLLSPTLTLPATWASSLFLKHTRHSQPGALVSGPLHWWLLPPPDTHMAASLTSFWPLLKYYHLSEDTPPSPFKAVPPCFILLYFFPLPYCF